MSYGDWCDGGEMRYDVGRVKGLEKAVGREGEKDHYFIWDDQGKPP